MASAAREYRYAHREFSTNGSLARDLDWAVRERELEHAGEVPRHERTQAAPKVYHKEQVLVRERQAIPVLSVLGVTAVAVAAVMLLLSYVQLTTLAADTVALKSELTVLQAENVSLTAQHEQMFDMATVKEVAAAAGIGLLLPEWPSPPAARSPIWIWTARTAPWSTGRRPPAFSAGS